MIWLAWRQFRKQALFTGIGLAVLAALMIPTGLAMHHSFDDLGLPECLRSLGGSELVPASSESCSGAINQFNNEFRPVLLIAIPFIFLPLFVGLFWGAPLISRELEHGTHRLVWTQGVSRRHWALVKFTLIGSATLAVATGYGLGMSWWLGPVSQTGSSRFNPLGFDLQGVAPLGYTLFAVALGIFVGTIWQKVLPAMALTLAGFVGLRIALTLLARPRYLPPATLTFPVQGDAPQNNPYSGDWVQAQEIRDASGNVVLDNAQAACPAGATSCGPGLSGGDYNWLLYQPADRFWLFQGIETGIYLALAAVLVLLAVRRIRRIA